MRIFNVRGGWRVSILGGGGISDVNGEKGCQTGLLSGSSGRITCRSGSRGGKKKGRRLR